VKTEFFDVALKENSAKGGNPPSWIMENSFHTASLAVEAAREGEDFVLSGFLARLLWLTSQVVPHSWIAWVTAKGP
jgi:short-subunit dehydrogenase